MIKKANNSRGQTALILILLSAAALIFLSITLNWGRIAQTKSMLTIAADQSASLLASNAASYGEQQKQTNLKDANQLKGKSSFWTAFFYFVLAIVMISIGGTGFAWYLEIASVALATINIVLQLVVIQPMITSLWNKLEREMATEEQFFEQGISTALEGSVTDRVNITDYFDSSPNGRFGTNSSGVPNDTISRFGLFYTDRLKMLMQPPVPQVGFFSNQLDEFINGETCLQNGNDRKNYPGIQPNLNCASLYCVTDPVKDPSNLLLDPNCQKPILGGFQLNDPCPADPDSNKATYTPYCDPCCLPPIVNGKYVRPSYCNPSEASIIAECGTNNPYNSYPYIYDPAFQNNYMPINLQNYDQNGASFLDKFGRDEQQIPGALPLKTLTPQGSPSNGIYFPNGIYPFFWLMKYYGPEVDTTIPGPTPTTPISADSQYLHWCAPATTAINGATIPTFTTPTGFSALTQLGQSPYSLPYTCQGKDCCVYYLGGSLSNSVPAGGAGNISSLAGGPGNVPAPTTLNNLVIDKVGGASNPAIDPSFGEGGKDFWLAGDNQMCISPTSSTPESPYGWPYNGASATTLPDGTCEWTSSGADPSSTEPSPSSSTVDSLDDTMQTLSDFVSFSNTFFSNDAETLSTNFNAWYQQAADWIAPKCADGDSSPACNSERCDDKSQCSSGQCSDGTSCGDNYDGRLLSIYEPPNYPDITSKFNSNSTKTVDRLKDWNTAVTKWLQTNYANDTAWCVPSGTTGSPNEDNYINNQSQLIAQNAKTIWGDLPHVIACLNYNAYQDPSDPNSPLYNYQQCQNALVQNQNSGCKLSLTDTSTNPPMSSCASQILGRSLAGPAPAFQTGTSCDPKVAGSFANWVQNSMTLMKDEAPKFALRSAFLTDVYKRAQTMQNIFSEGDTALHNFLKGCNECVVNSLCPASGQCTDGTPCLPNGQCSEVSQCPGSNSAGGTCSDGITSCGAPNCANGGPAAQLIYARANPPPSTVLPNSVIYGWVDDTLANGQTLSNGKGYAHIVKVTAYSPARNGNPPGITTISGFHALLPWVKTHHSTFSRSYTLYDRDGYVYVSIKRWDQDHVNPVNFPNGHSVWQFFFHNPTTGAAENGNALPASCMGLDSGKIGFGLESATIDGLTSSEKSPVQISKPDLTALGNAFMLNDNGNGQVDPSAKSDSTDYGNCLKAVDALLASGTESHACAEYIAASPASNAKSIESNYSQNGDADYSLKFVDCRSVPGMTNPPPEDMKGTDTQ